MQQSRSQEANSSSACQEIPRVLWLINVHHRVHNSSPIFPVLSHINPVLTLYHIARRSILTLPSHLHLDLPSGLIPSGLPTKPLYTTLLCHVTRLSDNEIGYPRVLKRRTMRVGEKSGSCIMFGVDTGGRPSDISYNFCSICWAD